MKIKHVLFPTDFSGASEAAGRVALGAARQGQGTLHVIHVVPPVTDPSGSAEKLARLTHTLGDGVPVETTLLFGRPARQIVDYAQKNSIDLVVLGTHGRTGVSRAILGSVAEGVVRLAPCLVLTVPPFLGATAPAAAPGEQPVLHRCLVCAQPGEADELVCEGCRAKIRGEALERKTEAERSGHRGLPI